MAVDGMRRVLGALSWESARISKVGSMLRWCGLAESDHLAAVREFFVRFGAAGMLRAPSQEASRHGSRATISAFRPRILLETYHRPDDMEVLPAILYSANPGYTAYCGDREFTEERSAMGRARAGRS